MKIGYFGDSYCAANEREHIDFAWTELVAKELGCEIHNECIHGDTLFHAYKYLEECEVDLDYLVFCISDPIRLPNQFRVPTLNHGFNKKIAASRIKNLKEYQTFINLHKLYTPKDYTRLAQKGILFTLDEFFGKKDINTLIIPSFDNSMQGYVFKNAGQANLNLNEDVKKRSKLDYKNDVNHMMEKENRVLAKAVIDYFKNNKQNGIIDFKKYFKYLDK